jgi:adhesin/invasin
MLPEWSPSRIAEGAPSRPFATSRRFTTRRALTSLGLGLIALWACDDLVVDDRTLEIGTTGTVEGSVFLDVDGSGTQTTVDQPAPGIRVRIVRAGQGSAVASAESDSAGTFRMDSVPVGEFLLNVDSASVPDSVRVVELDTTPFVIMPGETVRRDVRLSFPEYTLAEVRELETGLRVFTHGIALNTRFSFGDGIVHLREGDVHLRVTEVARGSVTPQPQDSVRVLGRTAREAGRPILTDARLFVLQPEAVPPLVPEYVSTGTAATADDARLDAALVEIREARILDTIPEGPDLIVTVDDGSAPVEVRIRGFLEFDRASLEPGTRQLREATGLLEAVQDEAGSVRWRLLLRTADDAAVDEYAPPDISASGSTVAAEPGTVVADGVTASTVTVVLRTADGEVIDEPRSVTLSVTTGPGELSTGTPDFDPATNSYSAVLTSTAAGTAVVAAAADGVALTQQPVVEFVAGATAALDVTGGQGQTGAAGEPLADPLEVRVADAFGNPVAGGLVTWSPGEGSGSADPAASETDASGLARTSWTLGPDAGGQTLVAASDGVEDGVTFTATAEAPVVSASESSVTAEPGTVVADGQEAATITLTLRDAEGNLIEEQRPVELSVEEGIGTFADPQPPFDPATSTYTTTLTSTQAGTATIVAEADGVVLDVQPQVGFLPGGLSADESLVVADPGEVVADGVEASTITVTLRDAQQNLITEAHTVTLEIAEGPGALSTTTPAFDPATNTYSATVTSTDAGVTTVRATADGTLLTQQAVVGFVSGAVSASLSSAVAGPTEAVADGADESTIAVTLRDGEGNLITDQVTVTVLVATGPGSVGSVTFDPGTSTYSATLTSAEVGTTTVAVVADGVELDDRPVVDFVPGPVSAGESSLVADPTAVPADGTDASTLTVTLRDAQQHLITEEQAVTLTVIEGPGTLSVVAFDAVASTYTATLTSTSSGTATVQATAGGVTLTQQAVVDFAAGDVSAETSSVVADPIEVTADGVDASTITVTLRDGEGNLIEDEQAVVLGIASGPGTLSAIAFDGATSTYSATLTSTVADTTTVAAEANGIPITEQAEVGFVAGPAAALSISGGDGQTGTVGETLPESLEVRVADTNDNPVEGAEVTWTPADGHGTAAPVVSITGPAGLARTAWTLGTGAGAHRLTAGVDGLTSVEFAATATVGPVSATVSSMTASPTGGVTADGSDASTVMAVLMDEFGNRITTLVEEDFLVLLEGDGGHQAVRGPITQLGSPPGRYVFDVTNTAAETVTVTLTADGVTLEDRPTIAFVPGGVSAETSSVVADPAEVTADGTSESVITVTLRDGEGNLIEDEQTVVLGIVSGPGTLSALTFDGVTNSYSATLTSTVADTTTVAAEANGTAITEQAEVVFVAGEAVQLVFTSSETDLASGATRTLRAEVRDGAGNLVTTDEDRTVTFAQTAGDGTVTGLGTATTAGGIAELEVTGEEAGAVTIEATAPDLTAGTTTFTVTVGG